MATSAGSGVEDHQEKEMATDDGEGEIDATLRDINLGSPVENERGEGPNDEEIRNFIGDEGRLARRKEVAKAFARQATTLPKLDTTNITTETVKTFIRAEGQLVDVLPELWFRALTLSLPAGVVTDDQLQEIRRTIPDDENGRYSTTKWTTDGREYALSAGN